MLGADNDVPRQMVASGISSRQASCLEGSKDNKCNADSPLLDDLLDIRRGEGCSNHSQDLILPGDKYAEAINKMKSQFRELKRSVIPSLNVLTCCKTRRRIRTIRRTSSRRSMPLWCRRLKRKRKTGKNQKKRYYLCDINKNLHDESIPCCSTATLISMFKCMPRYAQLLAAKTDIFKQYRTLFLTIGSKMLTMKSPLANETD